MKAQTTFNSSFVEQAPDFAPPSPGTEKQPSPRAPRPLARDLPAPDQFPTQALGPILEPAVLTAQRIIQAPMPVVAWAFLAAVNHATQALADVEIDGRRMPLSEYFISIAETGDRKSSADNVALAPTKMHERALEQEEKVAQTQYETDIDEWESERKSILSSKSEDKAGSRYKKPSHGEPDRKTRLEQFRPKPETPLRSTLLMSEPTIEGMERLFAEGQPSLGLFSGEGGRFVGGYAMNDEHQLRTASTLSIVWDCGELDRVRGGSGATKLRGRRFSMHLMMQPSVAPRLYANSELKGQGFTARCLPVIGQFVPKQYVEEDVYKHPSVVKYSDQMLRVLERKLPLKQGERNVLEPPALKLSPEAKELYIRFHNGIQPKLGKGGPLEPIRGLAAKAHDHAARVAGTLAIFANPSTESIELEHIESGIAIVTYCLGEARKLFDAAAVDLELSQAQELLEWILKKKQDVIALVEIYQLGPNSVRTAKTARALTTVLADHGWLIPNPSGVMFQNVLRTEAFSICRG